MQWKRSLGDYPDDFKWHLDYVSSDLSMPDTLMHLPNDLEDNTYFLSVPPERYENAIVNLKEAGKLDDPQKSRVVIEKPFGHDYKSAHHLQSVVERHLREKQVYRIDHYLGKDTVNSILATRFSNILLEPLWNRNYIDEVQIFATETISCDGRSQYYDTAGVVRDMLQNHILQVLSLIAMEAPCNMTLEKSGGRKQKFLLPLVWRTRFLDNTKTIALRRALILTVTLLPSLLVLYMSITGAGRVFLFA